MQTAPNQVTRARAQTNSNLEHTDIAGLSYLARQRGESINTARKSDRIQKEPELARDDPMKGCESDTSVGLQMPACTKPQRSDSAA